MTVLSLFDGISCGKLAIEKAGIEIGTYYTSEVDKYAIAISDYNHPETIKLGDVTNISPETLPKIDLLIGGSPCQSFSFAGKRVGMTTEEDVEITSLAQYLELKSTGFAFKGQSYLFWEYMRILKYLQKQNPNMLFLLENVSMAKKWETVLSKAIGVEPISINSELVSAQNRKRLYWTNINKSNILPPKDKHIFLKDIIDYSVLVELEPNTFVDKSIKPSIKQNVVTQYSIIVNSTKKIQQLTCTSGFQDNKVGIVKSPTLRAGNSFCLALDKDKVVRKITVIEAERLQTLPDNYTKFGNFNGSIKQVSNTQRFKTIGNGWTIDVLAYIFSHIQEENK